MKRILKTCILLHLLSFATVRAGGCKKDTDGFCNTARPLFSSETQLERHDFPFDSEEENINDVDSALIRQRQMVVDLNAMFSDSYQTEETIEEVEVDSLHELSEGILSPELLNQDGIEESPFRDIFEVGDSDSEFEYSDEDDYSTESEGAEDGSQTIVEYGVGSPPPPPPYTESTGPPLFYLFNTRDSITGSMDGEDSISSESSDEVSTRAVRHLESCPAVKIGSFARKINSFRLAIERENPTSSTSASSIDRDWNTDKLLQIVVDREELIKQALSIFGEDDYEEDQVPLMIKSRLKIVFEYFGDTIGIDNGGLMRNFPVTNKL
jgi:hypothetical protein